MTLHSSISEDNGLNNLTPNDQIIYSIGISTGGIAEMRMAQIQPGRQIIATTIDQQGVAYAINEIEKSGLTHQIEVKLEDVTKPLPYSSSHFDFIYARLILHYLSKQDLDKALMELHRVVKKGGKLFVVVRSVDCPEAHHPDAIFDAKTYLTTYYSGGQQHVRYFHSEESIKTHLTSAGFSINYVRAYQEQLCIDFQRQKLSKNIDSLIEVLAVK